MEPIELLLLGQSVAVVGFVGFSLKKQYRYATQVFDMLRLYPILVIASFLIQFFGVMYFEIENIDATLLISPFVGVAGLILFYYSLDWFSDYSKTTFREFLEGIKTDDFKIISYEDYENGHIDPEKVNVFLRHDVDISLRRAVKMAETQKELGIQSTYFFRLHAEKYTFEEAKPVIEKLADDGFGIGLHYETLSVAKGDKQKAIELLERDIQRLREIAPVSVVAAHGQKMYKNRTIWEDVDRTAIKVSSAYDMK